MERYPPGGHGPTGAIHLWNRSKRGHTGPRRVSGRVPHGRNHGKLGGLAGGSLHRRKTPSGVFLRSPRRTRPEITGAEIATPSFTAGATASTVVVLDSGFLSAYHNARDVNHAVASAAMDRVCWPASGGPLASSGVRVLEVVTFLMSRRSLAAATTVGTVLLRGARGGVRAVLGAFSRRLADIPSAAGRQAQLHGLSIVAVARRNGPGHAATFDTAFRDLDGVEVVS
jgi:predicted nucleic acid-binding protein